MESGGQPGNQNAKKAKRWQKALERALARLSESDTDAGLDKIADAVAKAAASGDKDAWKEIGDRIDGKPSQDINLNIEDEFTSLLGALAAVSPEVSGVASESDEVRH